MSTEPAPPLRLALAGMIGMAVAMGIGRFVYTPILPAMMEQLGLSASDAGLIASANFLGYLAGAVLAAGGWAQGRERVLMLAGLGASTILAAAMAVSDNLAVFLAVRLLAGFASAFVMVFLASIVFSHLVAAQRGDLQALHFAGVGLGIALSSAMILLLGEMAADWRADWYGSAALSALGFVAVACLVDRGPYAAGPTGREPRLPDSPALRRIIVAYGLFGLGYIVTATFLVAIVRQGDGGRQFEALVWLVTGLAGIPSVFLWNRLANSLGMPAAYVIACVVEAAGVAASVMTGGRFGPLFGGVLFGATVIAITALGLQLARLHAPLSTRRAFALMTASFGVGQIVGPVMAGFVAQWSGSFFLPSLCAALALLLSALLVWSVRDHGST